MKNIFLQYKPFIVFLTKFLISYLILSLIYESYLNQFNQKPQEVDGFTTFVATNTIDSLIFFNQNAVQKPNLLEPSIKLIYNNKYVARVVEGCNALSVIILFISFVIAFTGKLKHTLVFILLGSLTIHILNVARIALLCVLLYRFPEFEHLLHGVIFPLIIYGFVFLLWIIWVNKFSIYAEKSI